MCANDIDTLIYYFRYCIDMKMNNSLLNGIGIIINN